MTQEMEIQRQLDIEQSKKENYSAAEIAKRFYEDNQIICDKSFQYYKDYGNLQGQYIVDTVNIMTMKQARQEFPQKIILIITANDIEQDVLLRYFAEKNLTKWKNYLIEDSAYQILQIHEKTIVHVHAIRTGDEFTRRAINNAAKIFLVHTLLLLGICYGIDSKEQHIGEVVISNFVYGYRINFRDNDKDEVSFEPEMEFSKEPAEALNNRISGHTNCYQPLNLLFEKWGGVPRVSWKAGKLLSANSLMSSKAVKDSVVRQIGSIKPKAYGGEMEACGIFKSNLFEENGFRNWLVIKSICDWGEKKNSLFPNDPQKEKRVKDSFQSLAMLNTCSAFEALLVRGVFD